jgi:hypothetical protein
MLSFRSVTVASTMAAAAVLLVSAAFADTATPAPKSQCAQCQPTPVTVRVTDLKGRPLGTKTVTKMNCPGCMDPVTSLLNRGKFEHTCSLCGDNAKEICATH